MKENDLISYARNVITDEINALYNLKDNLPDDFYGFIQYCKTITGKIIVTGVGKSGIIGKKIAASFASTGTPSFFVHPTEANHGDLGMIEKDDLCIAISNSGESTELQEIINYTSNNDICLACLTSNPKSVLAKRSKFILNIPDSEEACPLRLAPTTSSVLTLVLGDALVLSLMKLKKFNENDYKVFHPVEHRDRLYKLTMWCGRWMNYR